VWSATTLASSFSELEADAAAQLAPVRGIERSQLGTDWHRYAVSRDLRHFNDAGGWHPQLAGVGVGKRRWYATIFSVDRPRSRSISAERRSRSLSRAGSTPRSSPPWSPSCRAGFTCASCISFRQAGGWPGAGLFFAEARCIEPASVLAVPRRGPRSGTC
jgi:hypothetical protein